MATVIDPAPAELPKLPPIDLPALELPKKDWKRWASRGFSLALLIAVIAQLASAGPAMRAAVLPDTPWFWIAFVALYFALPAADFLIYRRLWKLPMRGFDVLVRKRISNELLVAYSGEAQFYLWARERAGLVTAPFGAIKDVNILSALIANILTLALMFAAYPFVMELETGRYANAAIISVAAMLVLSLLVFAFRRKLFSLPKPDLLFVTSVHVSRLVITTMLIAVVWALALPAAPLSLWLMLATLRMIVSRLPLLPAKELLFATIAIFLIGQSSDVASLIALTAALTTGAHILFGGILALADIFERRPR